MMTNFVVYGTEFDDFDSDQGFASTSKPLGIEEQEVKDERGKRRFHGAFTGGFSAGYFNSVGSKDGWEPKQFLSTRDERMEKTQYKPEDFMDDEDLGEFGIAARRMRTSKEVGGPDANKHKLAWERGAQSLMETALNLHLDHLIKPVGDSIGVQILMKMGWKEGQGIGPKATRSVLEKHLQNEERGRGKSRTINVEAIIEANEMAPNFLFAPTDIDPSYLKSFIGLHGLGYKGLKPSNVLSQKYGTTEAALKVQKKSRGITGQAFGVGAFEDDDESIYTNFDYSQYDFSIGDTGKNEDSCSSVDTRFVMAEKRQGTRRFFEPPRLPPNFKPFHTPIFPNVLLMPKEVKNLGEKMNHLQRAKFLGEVNPQAILELIHDKDRERLAKYSNLSQNHDSLENLFEEEPMKQARFKQYISYLKRGLNMKPPSELSTLEWEEELNDFQKTLPPKLRALLPDVKARQKPLARIELASPIAEILKSKFTSSTHSIKYELKSDRRLPAVQMKLFGEMTHVAHEWHPAKHLAKRFNIPDPYPSSTLVGVPYLQKAAKTETLENLGSSSFGSFQTTAIELEYRKSISNRSENAVVEIAEADKAAKMDGNGEEHVVEAKYEKAPDDLLKAIFDYSDEESDEDEITNLPSSSTRAGPSAVEKISTTIPKKIFTVMDIVDEEYGPTLPPMTELNRIDECHADEMVEKRMRKDHKHSKKRREKNAHRHTRHESSHHGKNRRKSGS